MPEYPEELEKWWLKEAARFLRTVDERAATFRLAESARELSDLFTSGRVQHFGEYGERPELLRAYGLYAFPQTFVRTQWVLQELTALGRLETPKKVLDLGCGTGAASAAIRSWFGDKSVNFHLVDQSPESLAIASQLFTDVWPGTRVSTQRVNASGWTSPEKFDLAVCSFALGEMFFGQPAAEAMGWMKSVARSLNPNGWIVILEPALKETTERLMELRDRVAAEGWEIAAPCPHHQPCPIRKEGKYWCHEVRNWPVPSSLQRLNSQLGRNVHELKFSFLVARPPTGPLPPSPSRLVAPVSRLKGRWATRVCDSSGQLLDIVIPKSKVDDELRLTLKSLERGDRVTFDGELKPIG